LVAVIDPKTAALKWWNVGPWLKQHDPDFPAGRPDLRLQQQSGPRPLGHSEDRPHNTGRDQRPCTTVPSRFYSAEMGSHQYQPNGNILITVPGEGRVLLVSPHGEPIMEFNNVSSQSSAFNEHVENSAWFPPGYFKQPPACASTS
jgi:hypothetical protein